MKPGELTITTLRGVDQSLGEIKNLIRENVNSSEIFKFDNYSLQQIFDYVKNLPYRQDPKNFEWLQSPRWTLHWGGDCDDKAILLGTIFERRNIPYRMAVVSTDPNEGYHHIYLEILLNNNWYPVDATYSDNKLFVDEPFYRKRIYSWYGSDDISVFELDASQNKLSSQNSLAGNTLGESARLAILRGNRLGCSGCNYNSNCPCKQRAQLLGFDPGTIIAAASVVSGLFSSLFKKERYQDAYNAWEQAVNSLNQAAAQNNFELMAANRAIIAVLSRDYMNPPLGADFETSPGRKGNRAEWSKIQPAVMQKAEALAPFFYWLQAEMKAGRMPDRFPLEEMVVWYDDFKNGGSLSQQYQAAVRSGNLNSSNTAGAGQLQKLLPFVLAGVAIYFLT